MLYGGRKPEHKFSSVEKKCGTNYRANATKAFININRPTSRISEPVDGRNSSPEIQRNKAKDSGNMYGMVGTDKATLIQY